MLVCSPMCTAFSRLQALNKHRRKASDIEKDLRIGKMHVNFCMKLCQIQHDEGRLFMFEHPDLASSWELESVKKVSRMDEVMITRFDMCEFEENCKKDDQGREVRTMKPTKIMSNSMEISRRLGIKCSNKFKSEGDRHVHEHLLGGKAKQAQIYTKKLCRMICECVASERELRRRQMISLDLMEYEDLDGMLQVCREDDMSLSLADVEGPDEELHYTGDMVAYDDQKGDELDPAMVQQARREEMEYFRSMQVYQKVNKSECWEATGKKPVQTRWIDINKGDVISPNYRSRLVAKEFNDSVRPDLYVATPPMEAMGSTSCYMRTCHGRTFTRKRCGPCTLNCPKKTGRPVKTTCVES